MGRNLGCFLNAAQTPSSGLRHVMEEGARKRCWKYESGYNVGLSVAARTGPLVEYFHTFIIRKHGGEGSIYVMIFRSYLPLQTHCGNQVSGIADNVI